MEGVEYTAEPEHMNDEEMADARESGKKARTDSYRHPSTYPPLPGQSAPPMYSVPPSRSRDPSISSQGPLSSIQHFNAGGPGSFPPSGMTESPKPISPGQSGDHRGNMSGPPRPHQSYGSSGRGTSPMGLPPPHISGGPQLPGIHGFATPGLPGGPAHPGSISSHSSSGASTRELLGSGPAVDLYATVRDLKNQLNRTHEDHNSIVARLRADYSRMEDEYQKRIDALNKEVGQLRKGGIQVEEPAEVKS
jgi:hypothetical protein